jgi:hypothetical protein
MKGLIALALLVVVLGAQFHFLADLDSGRPGPHACPICSALEGAFFPLPPVLGSLVVLGPAQQMRSKDRNARGMFLPASPRAPPGL